MTLLETLQHLERLANPIHHVGDDGQDVTLLDETDLTAEECAILFEAFLSMTDTVNESVEIIERLEAQVATLNKEIEEKRKIWTP